MLSQYEFISESTLVSTLNEQVLPFWEEKVKKGYFTTPDHLNIHYAYAIPPSPISNIVICSGRTEAYVKYQELIFELFHAGFAVFIVDHRGQGFSSRLLSNPHIGHVEEFSHYVDDFRQFINEIVQPKSSGPLNLLAHSMGGAIATLYMMRHPKTFAKAALLSPMFGISSGFVPPPLARSLVDMFRDTLLWDANKEKYFPGQANYHDRPFSDNPLTTSEVRFRIIQETNHKYPETQLGGISFHWLHTAIEAIDKILGHATTLMTPTLLISAGNDRVVDNESHQAFQEKNTCQHITIEGAEHELLFECDSRRQHTLSEVLSFFA